MQEVEKHNTEGDLWVVINDQVWDLTEFAAEGHPGGNLPLKKAAGKDASNVFNPLHPPGTIETALHNSSLSSSALVGKIDPTTIKKVERPEQGETISVKADSADEKIDLGMIVGLPDFTVCLFVAVLMEIFFSLGLLVRRQQRGRSFLPKHLPTILLEVPTR